MSALKPFCNLTTGFRPVVNHGKILTLRSNISMGIVRHNSVAVATTQDVRSNDCTIETVKDLAQTGVFDKSITDSLSKEKFTQLTPVQQQVILPIVTHDKGLVCRAKTGTGKTLAFALPTLQDSIKHGRLGKVRTLVIAPTRDLAIQIENEYLRLVKHMPIKYKKLLTPTVHIGGKRTFFNSKGISLIAIATPGRLNDNLNNEMFKKAFDSLRYRIYDEGDRLLDQGFERELYEINEKLRESRNVDSNLVPLLFSATVNDRVHNFALKSIGRNYDFINTVNENEPEAHENIEQILVKTGGIDESFKGALCFSVKAITESNGKVIVFLPTINAANWFFSAVKEAYFSGERRKSRNRPAIVLLHGKKTQLAREIAVLKFRTNATGILVTTDVAARGLDFKDVSHVVQMTPSMSLSDYIHKIGRTARAGAHGQAILYSARSEEKYINALEKEKGIKFSQVIQYGDEHKEKDDVFFEQLGDLSPEFQECTRSLLSYYKQVSSVFGIPFRKYLDSLLVYYRLVLNDPSAKFPFGKKFSLGILNIPDRVASSYFSDGNRQFKSIDGFTRFTGYNKYGSRGDDRNGYDNRNKFDNGRRFDRSKKTFNRSNRFDD